MILPISNFRYNTYKYAAQIKEKPEFTPVKLAQTPVCSPIYFTSNFNKAKKVYVLGHQNPDTDCVASAIAYAHLRNQFEKNTYIPIAAGDLSSETKFALDYFDVEHPKTIDNFETKITEITTSCIKNKEFLYDNAPIKRFGDLLLERNLKSVPVVKKNAGNLVGMVSEKDLAKVLLSQEKLPYKDVEFKAIREALSAEVIVGKNYLNQKLNGRLVVGASMEQTTIDSLKKNDLLIVGDRERVQKEAIEKGVKGIIVTRGREVSDEVVALARKKGVIILSTSLDTYSTAKAIELSMPVRNIMTKDPKTIDAQAYVRDIRRNIQDYPYRSYPVVKDGLFIGKVDKDDILNPPDKEFILVDHNAMDQVIKGVKNEEITGIIDHHEHEFKSQNGRITEIYDEVGSSAALVAMQFKAKGVKIPPNIAGILLSAIISDTDLFSSPTTSPDDKIIAEELAKIAKITDIKAFGMKLLLSGEKDLANMTTGEAIHADIKKYTPSGNNILISQIKSCNPDAYLEKFSDIYEGLEALDNRLKVDGAIVMFTNKLDNTSRIYASDKFVSIAEKFLKSSDNKSLQEEAIGGKTMEEALDIIIECAQKKIPAIFENTSSRKEQVQPFVNKVCSISQYAL